ncbi:9428_t:CDS:2 [Ambispora gerdemannii]|uniref:9428_t:CDS:1 n=1 Tax=Ambispora gerdemannii TaxID=144530 RepID=A0A9N8W184_9GLOM|nr:9428_t:CDS:2 [Ambispora gerdemannii]
MSILFSRLFRELVRTSSRARNVTSNLEKQQQCFYSYSTSDPSRMTSFTRRTTAPKLKKYNSLPLGLPDPEERFPSGSPKQTAQFLTGKDSEGRSVVIHPLIGGGKSILRKSYKGDLVPLVPPDEMHVIDEYTIQLFLGRKCPLTSMSNRFFTLIVRRWEPSEVHYQKESMEPVKTFRWQVLTNNKYMDKKPTVRLRIRRRIREALRYVLPLVGKERHDYLFFGRFDTHEAEWEELKDAVHAAIALPRLYNFHMNDKRGGPNYLEYIERVGNNRRGFNGVQREKYAQKSWKFSNDNLNNYNNNSSRSNYNSGYDSPRNGKNKLNNEDPNYRDWDLQPLKILRDSFNDFDNTK